MRKYEKNGTNAQRRGNEYKKEKARRNGPYILSLSYVQP